MALAEQVGLKIKELRERRGMTQSSLAEAAELTSDEVSRIERGVREPRFGTIERLAAALNVATGELFSSTSRGYTAHDLRPSYEARVSRDGLSPEDARVADQCARAVSRILSTYLRGRARHSPAKKKKP